MDSAYYTTRIVLADVIKNASAYIATSSAKDILAAIESGTAPALVQFIATIAEQFSVRVTKKMLAQVAPIVGALGGAGINVIFSNYFQQCARFHFGLKKLEHDKGYEITREHFELARKQIQDKNKKV